MHKTGSQVYHGLACMFIIDDEGSDKLGLPDEYGVDDIPCTIQDRRFNQDGTFSYMSMMPSNMMNRMSGGGDGDHNESGMFRINGKSMDINRIDFQVKANSTEIWEIGNASPMAHPFHVHNVQCTI